MTRKKSVQPLRIIAIPDSHAKPNIDTDRFEWLGKLICDYKPTTLVNAGDMFDMPSLCHYDRGGKSFEGRRYHLDIAAGIEALDRIEKTVLRTKWGKANYEGIDKHFCMGNHEARISRVLESTAEYEGLISYDDFKLEEYGYTIHPYLEAADIGGVLFSHSFISGVMGKPIGGLHSAANVISKHFRSAIFGHSHTYDLSQRTGADGRRMTAINIGCYFEHDEAYAGAACALWSRGIQLMDNVVDGDYDHQWLRMETMRKLYGIL